MSQATKQLQVVSKDATPNQGFEKVALFDADGQPVDLADLITRVQALENA